MLIRVGMSSCGIAAGANDIWSQLEPWAAGVPQLTLEKTGCIGLCFAEPLMDIIADDGHVYSYGNLNAERALAIAQHHLDCGQPLADALLHREDALIPFLKGQRRIALRNCGNMNPESLTAYMERGGYGFIGKVKDGFSPTDVIAAVKSSGLRGRGGAGFPTWMKWDAARTQAGEQKYIICNADEGDPGAFMDRSILEGDPHSVLEGMMIAGFAIGASQGLIYCRAEYPLAIKRLQIAIEAAEAAGVLGKDIAGSGFDFTISIRQGAGAFVCGEETALIASLEGERGMPRLKPPFPSEKGYRRHPSVINNVETLANLPWIISNGGEAFAAVGSPDSKGTKVFALAGKIKQGGLVEVPMGISLREIIYDLGGGIKNDKRFKAVQLGGPSGGCIPESLLDIPVDYQSINATGAIMGSGGMIVMDEDTCMVDLARYFLNFTQEESCGKCVQCRLGTRRMLEILERICAGDGQEDDLVLLEEIALQVKAGSLCGLGQSAPNPVLTTLNYFRSEYEAHIHERRCPAHQCKALIRYYIDPEKCKGCGLCGKQCPVHCISGERKQPWVIDEDKCSRCGTCMAVCPSKWAAIMVE
ncbi:MAG: NADH-quinone oxidoreductase subunit NuoF [Syntrophomonadaceae bacterium]|nr:NADH-quinone oxidoreductase subunit NuoF [Syntrophomonadaceae bacterium]